MPNDTRPLLMLVVTRLPPGSCHVAQATDELARDFKCGKDETKMIGETGQAVSLAKR